MAAQDAFNPGQEAATITAAPNLNAVQAQYNPNADVNSLLSALGSKSTQQGLDEFQQIYTQKKTQDQVLKIDHYTQTFLNDHNGGSVSQAQVRERFPETVPVIAARIAESIGKKQGYLQASSIVESINNNDDLRLDTTKRSAYIAQKRQEMAAGIAPGNDFYSSGVVSAMDRAFGEQELKWQGQTSVYHEKVQLEAHAGEVEAAFLGNNTKAALALIDSNYGMSSSLGNLQRKDNVVKTVIGLAARMDNPDILDRVPQQFLNTELKTKIAEAKIHVGNQQMANYRRGLEIADKQREEQTRNDTLGMLALLTKGGNINVMNYTGNVKSFEAAQQLQNAPLVSEVDSTARSRAYINSLYEASFTRNIPTAQQITDAALTMPGINSADRKYIMEKITDIRKGMYMMNDETFKSAYSDNIGPSISTLMSSTNAKIVSLMSGRNFATEARKVYDGSVRQQFGAIYDTTGTLPDPSQKQDIASRAVSVAAEFIRNNTSIEALARLSDLPGAGPKAAEATPTANKAGSGVPSASSKTTTTPSQSLVDIELAKRAKGK